MTTQDLKDNREEIIGIINAEAIEGSLKEVMTYMLNRVNNGNWKNADPMYIDSMTREAITELELAKWQQPEAITAAQECFEASLRNQKRVAF
jgi:hypothetical protein